MRKHVAFVLAVALVLSTWPGFASAAPVGVNVTFDSRGGSAVASQTGLAPGSFAATPTPDPTKTGYSFAGWYPNLWPVMIQYYAVNVPGSPWTRSVTPFTSGAATQAVAGDAVTLSIEATTAYVDNGAVFWDGRLGDLPDLAFDGSGSTYSVNMYFDLNNNGTIFAWSGDTFTGLGGDTYGLGPSSSGGALTVTGTTRFGMMTGSYGPYTVDQLRSGSFAGIDANTRVSLWVGLTSDMSGGTARSATVRPAAWQFAIQPVNADLTLLAKWTANRYEVAFDCAGGSAVDTQAVDFGGLVTAPATSKAGRTLVGWFADPQRIVRWDFGTDTMPAHDMTLYAAWSPCTITASSGPNGWVVPIGQTPVTFGADAGFAIVPATGYHVAQILVDDTPVVGLPVGPITTYTFSNVVADHRISATFASDVAEIIPTSITIKAAASTTSIGKTVVLSGLVTPASMIGRNIVVYVQKPGSARWTYSSNRTVYALNGTASWWYRYYFKPGMAKGVYKFKAGAPAPEFTSSVGYGPSTSGIITITVR